MICQLAGWLGSPLILAKTKSCNHLNYESIYYPVANLIHFRNPILIFRRTLYLVLYHKVIFHLQTMVHHKIRDGGRKAIEEEELGKQEPTVCVFLSRSDLRKNIQGS